MGELWQGIGYRPELAVLIWNYAGEVLLRLGALTTQTRRSPQIQAVQEAAKICSAKAFRFSRVCRIIKKWPRPRSSWRSVTGVSGEIDEARVILQEAVSRLGNDDYDLKARAFLRSATFEASAQRFYEALRIYSNTAPLLDNSRNLTLRGEFHHFFGTLLKKLFESEGKTDYADRGLIEFAAASFILRKQD